MSLLKKSTSAFIVTVATLASCNNSVKGLYKNAECRYGPNCSMYEFCPDNTFKYQYWWDVIGTGKIGGTWSRLNDTLYLIPEKPFTEKQSHTKSFRFPDSANTKISVMLLKAGKGDHGDTIRTRWEISINKENKLLKTNDSGELLLGRVDIDSLWLVPETASTCFDNQWIKIDPGHNRIEIYVADCQFQPVPYGFISPKLVVRKNKIYDVWSDSENEKLKNNSYYQRRSQKCNTINLND